MALNDFFLKKLRETFPFEPTSFQDEFFKIISKFITEEDLRDIFILNGYAGTGKTEAIGAVVKVMKSFDIRFRLMAPTGRAAKVLANYTGEYSSTIHKQIYRQKSMNEGVGVFTIDRNGDKNTCYIVDEASLVTTDSGDSSFGTGNLLDDLFSYIRQGAGNKLILVGDNAQLPPISLDRSLALDAGYISRYGEVISCELTEVVRQAETSGILHNATVVRNAILNEECSKFPKLETARFGDVERIGGGELMEMIESALDKYGSDEVVVLCRSNKRANRYNAGIRGSILGMEEKLARGDKLMVVKNCYQFMDEAKKIDFIANGDVAELVRIGRYEERYGLHFAKATLKFPDYNNVELDAKVILDTLDSESAALSQEQQLILYEGVFADYGEIRTKRKRNAAVREDPYYNALQLKYASAITCHKSQGGQWKCVFIDNAFWRDFITLDDLKWLYTAITRATEKLYLINFNKNFFR